MNANWGPIATPSGMQSCRHSAGAPGAATPVTFDCTVAPAGLRLSITHPTGYGACGPNQASVQLWQRQ
jgi:hypothetical protein